MKNTSIFSLFVLTLSILIWGCNAPSSQNNSAAASSASDANDGPVQGMAYIEADGETLTILKIAASSEDHTTLAAGVMAAGLENVLSNPGPLTVFAPNNAAFDKLPEGTLDELLKEENKPTLKRIITHHAAPGTYTVDQLKDGDKLYMATGYYLDVTKEGGDTYVNGSKILGSVPASNGIVHVVGDVFLPPEE